MKKYLLIPLLLLPLIVLADGYTQPYQEFGFAIENRRYNFKVLEADRKEALKKLVGELKTLLLLAEWSLEVYEE